ncbi:MAG: SDR family oxidoreductase [Erysipelotrichaceae bacterium]|nr:SDR family oxidoreductase [Erysipelotrichaceae bacterium]
MNRLNDKVAIITGGNSGVGAATAKLFVDEGAQVVICARRKDKLDEVAREIEENGGQVLAVVCDISKPEDAKALVEKTVSHFGRLDILVNNAGIMEDGLKPIDKVTDEDLEHILDVNLKGTIYVTREAVREMEENGNGSIVSVAGTAATNGTGPAVYASSKAGIIGLTKHIALRYASQGIRANAINPGTMATPLLYRADPETDDPDMTAAMDAHVDHNIPSCTPEDAASLILFLAGDESRAVTGQSIVCDCGASL